MEAYVSAMTALKKMTSETFKGRQAYVEHIQGLSKTLDNVAEAFAEAGYSKIGTSVTVLRNKLNSLSKKIESGKITAVPEIKANAKEVLASLAQLDPKLADKQHTKAGISDQSKIFTNFNKKRVKISTDSDTAAFKLEKAPLLLLFRGRITPTQAKLLKSFNATFYQGTNGVSIPEIPILVLNKQVVAEKDYKRVVAQVLKNLKRPDLAVFFDEGVTKRNFIAFPVFEPKYAEIMSVIFFDALQSKELWVS